MRKSRSMGRPVVLRLLAVTTLVTTAMLAWLGGPADAASGFANDAFKAQWQAGEAITPNFWGPLTLAQDGKMEPYAEATGGTRLVQYFDKARMELTNSGTVTNGLLAAELIYGKVQTGDNTFLPANPAAIPVAGDPDNIGPTYASIAANAATLVVMTANATNTPVTRALRGDGQLGTFTDAMGDAQATISVFDSMTQHNVPKAFADYRTKVGLAAIGLAIAEPFWSNVKVSGKPTNVLIQPFERRVLTYTPSNPDAFKVEFGNIGQHYFTWRYNSPGALNTPTPASFPVTATANAAATGTATAATAAASATPAADTTAPKIKAAPVVPYLTPNSFTVLWSTDEPAGSELLFGETSNYEQQNNLLAKVYEVDHHVVIRNLTPGKTYHYRVQSVDPSGNRFRDDQDRTVTLPAEKNDGMPGAVPKITDIAISKTTATTFTVTWKTDLNSRSRIEFGADALGTAPSGEAYNRFRTGDNSDPSTTAHTATAITLEPNTRYRFRIVSVGGDAGILSSASNDKLIMSTKDNERTIAETSSLKITDFKPAQERPARPVIFTFGTDRNAAAIIEIGRTDKLGEGVFYGSTGDPQGLRDYPYPFNRSLHSISIDLRPGVYYVRLSVYDEQGTGTTSVQKITVQ